MGDALTACADLTRGAGQSRTNGGGLQDPSTAMTSLRDASEQMRRVARTVDFDHGPDRFRGRPLSARAAGSRASRARPTGCRASMSRHGFTPNIAGGFRRLCRSRCHPDSGRPPSGGFVSLSQGRFFQAVASRQIPRVGIAGIVIADGEVLVQQPADVAMRKSR